MKSFASTIMLAAVFWASSSHSATKFNPVHDKIMQLTEEKRNDVFTRIAINEKCGKVTRTFFQGQSQDGTASWSIKCTSGNSYSVGIDTDADGSTKLMDCGLLKHLTKVDCFTKFQ